MHQFGWLSERGGNFVNLLQKEEGTQKGGVPTLEETMIIYIYIAVYVHIFIYTYIHNYIQK